MRSQPPAVPAVQRITGGFSSNQRSPVGQFGFNCAKVKRDVRRACRANDQRNSGKAGVDRAVEMACEDGADLAPPGNRLRKSRDPRLVRAAVEPFEPGFDGRMVHRDYHRDFRFAVQPVGQPLRAGLTKRAAVAARFCGVECNQAKPSQRHFELDEAIGKFGLGKARAQSLAVVPVSGHQPDRKGAWRDQFGEAGIARWCAALCQIAGHQQQVGPVGTVAQLAEHGAKSLDVVLFWIGRVEADVAVGNLGNKHRGLLHCLRRGVSPRGASPLI